MCPHCTELRYVDCLSPVLTLGVGGGWKCGCGCTCPLPTPAAAPPPPHALVGKNLHHYLCHPPCSHHCYCHPNFSHLEEDGKHGPKDEEAKSPQKVVQEDVDPCAVSFHHGWFPEGVNCKLHSLLSLLRANQ